MFRPFLRSQVTRYLSLKPNSLKKEISNVTDFCPKPCGLKRPEIKIPAPPQSWKDTQYQFDASKEPGRETCIFVLQRDLDGPVEVKLRVKVEPGFLVHIKCYPKKDKGKLKEAKDAKDKAKALEAKDNKDNKDKSKTYEIKDDSITESTKPVESEGSKDPSKDTSIQPAEGEDENKCKYRCALKKDLVLARCPQDEADVYEPDEKC